MRRIKLVLAVAAAVAMLMVVSAPAMARDFNNNDNVVFVDGFGHNGFFTSGLNQDIANESETGNVDLSFGVSQTGDNSNQSVTPLQFGNTGSNQNAQGFTSFGGTPFDNNGFFPFDAFGSDVELSGGDFTFTPVLNAPSDQQVQQSSGASSF
jgi:hypothetical protein